MYAEKFFLSCQKQFRYPLQISFILSAEWSGTGAYGCSVLTDHSHSQEIDNEPDKYGIFCPLPGMACVTWGCININQNISTTKINVKMGSLTPAHSKALVQQALRNSCELLRRRKELHVSLCNCMQTYVTACKLT